MKQISIALSIMVLCISLSLFSSGQERLIDSLRQQISLLKLQIQHQDLPCSDCKNLSFKGISAKTARTLADNYNTAINQHHFDDTRSVWFSLDTLKAFICAIEKANANSCDKKLQLGIRIYYGIYPNVQSMKDNPDLSDLPRNGSGTIAYRNPNTGLISVETMGYQNRHTLFMVPTYQDNSDTEVINRDFDPLYRSNINCKPLDFATLLSIIDSLKSNQLKPDKFPLGIATKTHLADTSKVTIMSVNAESTSNVPGSVKNHGDLIPPSVTSGAAFIVVQ